MSDDLEITTLLIISFIPITFSKSSYREKIYKQYSESILTTFASFIKIFLIPNLKMRGLKKKFRDFWKVDFDSRQHF